ncbi:scavenger receptor cysteine-rich domain-containing protein DMBT1-like [Ptychodera flava]|uniref:scavenger receptor cysteine-rich domain-containing protein DMBT1-like n=1 Tax=Ptychodera flava TaxID=63121 RepID=UPI00396A8766
MQYRRSVHNHNSCTSSKVTMLFIPWLAVFLYTSCVTSKPALRSVQENQTVVRLVNGTVPSQGRVEVLLDGVWGTVCGDGFDNTAAHVVCRQLGYSGGRVNINAILVVGNGPIWLHDVRCTGSEASIFSCEYNDCRSHACVHHRDASVICNTSPPSKSKTVVRLVDDPSPNKGRVEVFLDGLWGTVCGDGFDENAARVVCRQLGYRGGRVDRDAKYGEGDGPVWLHSTSCSGDEASIYFARALGTRRTNALTIRTLDPPKRYFPGRVGTWLRESFHFLFLCLPYDTNQHGYEGDVRLVGGQSRGRLEIFHQGYWGTVCDDLFDKRDAEVVCQQLGFGYNIGRVDSLVPAGHGSVWLDDVHCTGSESHLTQCRHKGWGQHNCDHSEDVGVNCEPEDGDIRLIGGASRYEGRVEVFHANEWGTVCDDDFDKNDARVVCRQLDFDEGASAYSTGRFGLGSDPIWLDNLSCGGHEDALANCTHQGWGVQDCGHHEDIGVVCNAATDGDVRLVNGKTLNKGRLEIFHGVSWGTVCDDGFDEDEAKIVCRQLGYSGGTISPAGMYGEGSGQIWLDDVECKGHENELSQCKHRGWGTEDCRHTEDIGIICDIPEIGELRLVNGDVDFEGRLEAYYNGQWATVCDDEFDYKDAAIVCRQLGYSGGEIQPRGSYGQGNGQITLDDVRCTGHETSLKKCGHRGWNEHNCVHDEDISINCKLPGEGSIRLFGGSFAYEGRLEMFNPDEDQWETVCANTIDSKAATVACRQLGYSGGRVETSGKYSDKRAKTVMIKDVECSGLENGLMECVHTDGGDGCEGNYALITCEIPEEKDVRIVDGEAANEGRIEVYHDDTWKRICDVTDDITDVVCRQLGYSDAAINRHKLLSVTHVAPAPFGVRCNGQESSLAECDVDVDTSYERCTNIDDVYVECKVNNTVIDGNSVRLVGGNLDYEGRLEIYNSSAEQWQTVCGDTIDTKAARVVCRQLNFRDGEIGKDKLRFGQSDSDVMISDVSCDGHEDNLIDCPHAIGGSGCNKRDAIIICHSPEEGDLRLTNSKDENEGRLEIYHSGKWGSVCDDDFSQINVDVVCRQLGYLPGTFRVLGGHGESVGPIWLDDVNCTGAETSLSDCPHTIWGSNDCTHREDISIFCKLPDDNDIRLVGGRNPSTGRLEIYHSGVWGTVCDDAFDEKDAEVVCRQLGFSSGGAVSNNNANFSNGTGKVWLDEVECTGDERKLAECVHQGWGESNCDHSEDVLVTCTIS